jgi:hypothetical protein
MSGIPYYSQINMRVPATEANHLVRLGEVVDLIDNKTKAPVRLISLANFDNATFANNTLTFTETIDIIVDQSRLVLNDRILVNGQTDKTQNGIYVVTNQNDGATEVLVLTRDNDMDVSAEIFENMRVFVSEGIQYGGTLWKLTGTGPFVLNTSNLEFIQDIVKYTEILEKTFVLEGDDLTDEFVCTHDFGTSTVTFELFNSMGETVYAMISRISVNDVKVSTGAPLATGEDLTLIARAVVTPV